MEEATKTKWEDDEMRAEAEAHETENEVKEGTAQGGES